MKKLMTALFWVMSMAAVSHAEDSAIYLRAARSFNDDSNRMDLGLALASVKPGVYMRVTGEFGGILASKTKLDYRYDAAAGWKFGNAAATAIAAYGLAGFRQWTDYGQVTDSVESFYPGAGIKLSSRGTYLTGEVYRYRREGVWRPYVEVGTGISRQVIGVYYEKSPVGGNVVGIRYGFPFK